MSIALLLALSTAQQTEAKMLAVGEARQLRRSDAMRQQKAQWLAEASKYITGGVA